MSNIESTRSNVKNHRGHSLTELAERWVRGTLLLREKDRRDNCIHSNQESMDFVILLGAGTTLIRFHFDTQKTI